MKETYRKISLVLELERAIQYLRLGLSEICNISSSNDFYDPIFIYLSGGLERLFKTMLCLNFVEINGRLPKQNEIWNNRTGHDLKILKTKIESICIPVSQPFGVSDYELITDNKFNDGICEILAEFGKKARYFNLDAFLGVAQKFDSKRSWELSENEIGKELFGKEEFLRRVGSLEELENTYIEINNEMVIRIEKFLRALTRQFIFGDFSSESRTFIFTIEPFFSLENSDLGIKKYENLNVKKN